MNACEMPPHQETLSFQGLASVNVTDCLPMLVVRAPRKPRSPAILSISARSVDIASIGILESGSDVGARINISGPSSW